MKKTISLIVVATCLATGYFYFGSTDEATSSGPNVLNEKLAITNVLNKDDAPKLTDSTPLVQNAASIENTLLSNLPSEEHQSRTHQVADKNSVKEYAASQYPDFFYGDLSVLSRDDYYAKAVIKSNVDNKQTAWAGDFKQFIIQLDTYVDSGMLNEQIKCSSEICLITAKVKSKQALDAIFTELTGKHKLWGVGVGGELNQDGEYVFYIAKSRLKDDPFYKPAQ